MGMKPEKGARESFVVKVECQNLGQTLCSPFFLLSLEKIHKRKNDWWAHFLPHQQSVAGVGVGIVVRRLIDMISKGGTLQA